MIHIGDNRQCLVFVQWLPEYDSSGKQPSKYFGKLHTIIYMLSVKVALKFRVIRIIKIQTLSTIYNK